MAAAHYKLDNLTVILDHNGLQIDGRNDDVMSLGNICAKFAAFGFDTVTVNGHDIDAVTAVSYTHLDVYKRQEQSSAERRSPPITANFTNKPPPRSMVFGWT